MKDQQAQKMRLIVSGAISFYENEGLDIPSILLEKARSDLFEAYDAIGTALYWMRSELEK